jgi:hypothetical protein
MTFSLSIYQVLILAGDGNYRPVKLLHSVDFYMALKMVYFFIFLEILKLGKKHQHGHVSPGTSFHFQVFNPAIRNM